MVWPGRRHCPTAVISKVLSLSYSTWVDLSRVLVQFDLVAAQAFAFLCRIAFSKDGTICSLLPGVAYYPGAVLH